MEVRSADRGRGDLDNRVCWFLNLRIGNRINADVVFAVPAECSHSNIFFKLLTAYRCVDPRAKSDHCGFCAGTLYLAAATFIADVANFDNF